MKEPDSLCSELYAVRTFVQAIMRVGNLLPFLCCERCLVTLKLKSSYFNRYYDFIIQLITHINPIRM